MPVATDIPKSQAIPLRGALDHRLWLLLALYATALTLATHWPKIASVSGTSWSHADKLAHLIGYAVLTLLVVVATAGRGSVATRLSRPLAPRVLLILASVAAFGMVEELTQPLVGRTCDLGDWMADCGGALLAVGLAGAVRLGVLWRETQELLLGRSPAAR